MRRILALGAVLALTLSIASAQAQPERKPPYWGSISASKALMRTGPGRNYPATWLYRRSELPLRIIETYPDWRKVQDPDGEKGWMLQRLLSSARTGLVTGNEPRPIYEGADEHSRLLYRAEPGVVGRLSNCTGTWCRFDVSGRNGYIRQDQIWGADPGETFD